MTTVPAVWGRHDAELLRPAGARRQELSGFDSDFADIVDYILAITHRIWDQRRLDLIDRHYAPDCPVWTPAGPSHGAAAVREGTRRTLEAFPDRTLMAEAVIWSGDSRAGFLSSHRILSTATHLGPGAFGPPTGRRIAFRTVADCLCRDNRIIAEWLVRDTSAMALGLGLSPRALALAQPPPPLARAWWQAEAARAERAPNPSDASLRFRGADDAESFAFAILDALLCQREVGVITHSHWPAARLEAPGGRTFIGHDAIGGWWAALAGALARPAFVLDHVAATPAGPGWDLAARFTLAATHAAPGPWGPPTGQRLALMAIIHWHLLDGRISEAWLMIDEIALLRQLLHP